MVSAWEHLIYDSDREENDELRFGIQCLHTLRRRYIRIYISSKDFKRVDVFLEKLNGIHPSIIFMVERRKMRCPLQVSTSRPKGNFSKYETNYTGSRLIRICMWDGIPNIPQRRNWAFFTSYSGRPVIFFPPLPLYSVEKGHLLATFTELGYLRNRLLRRVKDVENPAFGPRNK